MKIRAIHIWITLLLLWSLYTSFLFMHSRETGEIRLNAQASRGKILWQENNCSSCHQVYGLGGYLGPDLTNVYSRGTTAYLKGIIKSGTAVMPAFDFSDDELEALAVYLRFLDSTGQADPAAYEIQSDGMIKP